MGWLVGWLVFNGNISTKKAISCHAQIKSLLKQNTLFRVSVRMWELESCDKMIMMKMNN